MIVWMVWDDRDRCHYRLRWCDEGWVAERYMNVEQEWTGTVQSSDIRKFLKGKHDSLLVRIRE